MIVSLMGVYMMVIIDFLLDDWEGVVALIAFGLLIYTCWREDPNSDDDRIYQYALANKCSYYEVFKSPADMDYCSWYISCSCLRTKLCHIFSIIHRHLA